MSEVSEVVLEACGKEPIHIPGAIQPFGVLLCFSGEPLVCTQASENCGWLLEKDCDAMIGLGLEAIFADAAGKIRDVVGNDEDPGMSSPMMLMVADRALEVSFFRSGGVLLMELEPAGRDSDPSRNFRRLQCALSEMRQARTAAELYEFIARFVAEFTGYERVMVYQFNADWNGEVVGECLLADVDSYLGLHFPASDIPEQARALYARNWLRIIPDAGYKPVMLRPQVDPVSGRPLDMSQSGLRSVSPIHLEYLRNMDVGASMSISLMVEGRLWGLIACHNRTPRPLSAAVRSACELFGQIASTQIETISHELRQRRRIESAGIQTRFFDVLAGEPGIFEALRKYTPAMLEFMNAGGAAIYANGALTLHGETPDETEVAGLVQWLGTQAVAPVFATHHLGAVYPAAAGFAGMASGLLALRLERLQDDYVLWFRPEEPTVVRWAGNPEKPADAEHALHPRRSFAAWSEMMTGRSLPWDEGDLHGARELLDAANAMLLRRTQALSRLNAELEKKNTDLNSFAYIASHDLREPLRGIGQYAAFVLEDHGAMMDADAVRKLETIGALAQQSEELIETLTRFSRLGRMEISGREISLEEVLDQVLLSLGTMVESSGVEIVRMGELPVVWCDPVLIREVFANLISNAIRYSDRVERRVEIGMLDRDSELARGRRVFYVRDNGIGIAVKHHENIFRIFRRLHEPDRYGGGSGAGLAIVKSIVERHGGSIWVESERGAGSTFFLTLE